MKCSLSFTIFFPPPLLLAFPFPFLISFSPHLPLLHFSPFFNIRIKRIVKRVLKCDPSHYCSNHILTEKWLEGTSRSRSVHCDLSIRGCCPKAEPDRPKPSPAVVCCISNHGDYKSAQAITCSRDWWVLDSETFFVWLKPYNITLHHRVCRHGKPYFLLRSRFSESFLNVFWLLWCTFSPLWTKWIPINTLNVSSNIIFFHTYGTFRHLWSKFSCWLTLFLKSDVHNWTGYSAGALMMQKN